MKHSHLQSFKKYFSSSTNLTWSSTPLQQHLDVLFLVIFLGRIYMFCCTIRTYSFYYSFLICIGGLFQNIKRVHTISGRGSAHKALNNKLNSRTFWNFNSSLFSSYSFQSHSGRQTVTLLSFCCRYINTYIVNLPVWKFSFRFAL